MVRPKVSTPAARGTARDVRYRAVQLDGGRLMPIEVRLGRRLLRTIPADSAEGLELLASGQVRIVPYEAWERGGDH
ncbi:MAG: hypothetical protein MUC67_06085 [Acidobacteria bacterium]|nr:hypothetical protein [Acidobacteriota bacterium]